MARLLLAALALAVLAGSLLLTGCDAECAGHGGAIGPPLGGWYYCHDGTKEYG